MAIGKQISAAQDALNFILAGNACFTMRASVSAGTSCEP